MPMTKHLFKRAIQLARDGQIEAARSLLEIVVRQEPNNENAWLWYVDTFESHEDRIRALERMQIDNPGNVRAQRILQKLRAEPKNTVSSTQQKSNTLASMQAFPSIPDRPHPSSSLMPGPISAQGKTMIPATVPWLIGVGLVVLLLALGASIFSTQARLNRLILQYDRLQKAHSDLQITNTVLQTNFNSLQTNYRSLEETYTTLQQDYSTLSINYTGLQQEYASLSGNYTNLQNQYNILQITYSTLSNDYQILQSQYTALQLQYGDLSGEYADFRSRAIAPPYIYISNRSVTFAFLLTDQTVDFWQIDFDSLEQALNAGYEQRQEPEELKLETDSGYTFTVMDFRSYIDPSAFYPVIGELYARNPREEDFIYEVWHIVTQLSGYSNDIEETPRYPLETFLAGGGDCEDTAILFASMILAAPVGWEVDLVYMDSTNPLDPQTSNHVIVYIKTGQKDYYVETTSDSNMLPYPDGVVGWYFAVNE